MCKNLNVKLRCQKVKTSAKDSLGLYVSKQQKIRFDEECSRFLDEMKQDKMQWLQDPTQSNEDNLNIVKT